MGSALPSQPQAGVLQITKTRGFARGHFLFSAKPAGMGGLELAGVRKQYFAQPSAAAELLSASFSDV